MRSVLVLFGAVLGVVAGMILLAAVVFPGSPPEEAAAPITPSTFLSGGASTPTAAPTSEGPVIDPTTQEGGVLRVSGDRKGTITLMGQDHGFSSYTLTGSGDRISFASEEDGTVFVDHVAYDGLDFFLDPGDCSIDPGEVNTERGISTVAVACPEITDLRDTATVTVEGTVGVASTLTGRDDLPDLGGSVTVSGDFEMALDVESGTWVEYPEQTGIFGGASTNLYGSNGIPLLALEAEEEGPLSVVGFGEPDAWHDVEPGKCLAQTEQLAVAAPDVTYHTLTLDCATVPLVEGGTVSIEGSVVVERVPFRR